MELLKWIEKKVFEITKPFKNLLKQEGIPVCQSYLYGSCAKNRHSKDSDIDVLILTKNNISINQKAKA